MPLDLGHPKGVLQIPHYVRNDKKERVVGKKKQLPEDAPFFITLGGPKAHPTLGMTKRRALLKSKGPLPRARAVVRDGTRFPPTATFFCAEAERSPARSLKVVWR
jgi:hypothetical protein